MEKIIGSLSTPKISGSLSTPLISGSLSKDYSIVVTLDIPISMEYETYGGETEVTPSTQPQVLLTDGFLMADNITVKKISYYETSNQTGKTVYIANEVN